VDGLLVCRGRGSKGEWMGKGDNFKGNEQNGTCDYLYGKIDSHF
jgi:hypothetical protein